MTKGTILVAAGGTGGHVMPATSLAGALKAKGWDVHFVTDPRGETFARDEGLSAQVLPLKGRTNFFQYALSLLRSFLTAFLILHRKNICAVVSFGGYVAFPVNLAAIVARKPLILHEQNAYIGRVNRWFFPFCKKLALSWPKTHGLEALFTASPKITLCGLPVRKDFETLRNNDYFPPVADVPFELLVVGGSQGASFFAQIIPKALARLPEKLQKRVRLSLQCPPANLEEVKRHCQIGNIKAEISVYFKDMDKKLAKAHWVMCRAGASSLAEVALAGRPALFVPYPHAMDDHQTYNAASFADNGAGWRSAQKDLTPEVLATHLMKIFEEPASLLFAAEKVRAQAKMDAPVQLAAVIEGAITPKVLQD
ncbi:MAG: UDP-N-acetylglucosamine--N-acetylmuramyl-(pentapeptide) pyrophosphoryl-undecaprenol N-acetylglucosamine transferase [Alphaproteobacteria bacterium]|jgi:UDP-N-acetylglucosamine--N-acetylmuramyl-(pentapeptide) pyrophosphoryl-undecaprenol N-acetylglucosamine transferase|nr:UDP-N-acetylglucosamine--N-acetylmuramyl-(pentapeptide) pyrophosphoryl-undecaprenol N-acetylglucosamine transferase [Alphaproteobacteria bacterium]